MNGVSCTELIRLSDKSLWKTKQKCNPHKCVWNSFPVIDNAKSEEKRFTYKILKSLQCDRSGILFSLFDFNSLGDKEIKARMKIEHHLRIEADKNIWKTIRNCWIEINKIELTSFSSVTYSGRVCLVNGKHWLDPYEEFPMLCILRAMVVHLNSWHPIKPLN